jgi:hypothetical protein
MRLYILQPSGDYIGFLSLFFLEYGMIVSHLSRYDMSTAPKKIGQIILQALMAFFTYLCS